MSNDELLRRLGSLPPAAIAVLVLLAVIVLALYVWAFVDLARRPEEQVLWGRKWVWALIILFLNSGLGAIAYLVFGRRRSDADEERPAADQGSVRSAVDSLYGDGDGDARS